MSLMDLVAGVEGAERTLTVYNPEPGVVEELRERFADRNLAVVTRTTLGGPGNFVVLSHRESFVTALDAAELLRGDSGARGESAPTPYRSILDHLDETTFTSYDRRRMLAASREIEDRAWRVGDGSLHAGFQSVEHFERQREVYERLGGRDELSVHAYVRPSSRVRPVENVRLHLERSAEIRDSWFVAFDGGSEADSRCALLATKRDPGRFYGFWTYDSETVEYVVDHLRTSYALSGSDPDDGASRC
ncbi:DICT sensory domain-containing protein [Halopelagius longus]|uniref:DICT domain-containing protein n=1 Tax=Halopelagius longus TaxID=1236180 RepID=A0A1H1GF93_9EURY|nr:DICT sensory domain-containing protein [Halopelagius longus]RDI69631.1 histidine kinase [Halopelagius longus]SDR11765.1 DICT domain-containing protein [Halopelagius longus]